MAFQKEWTVTARNLRSEAKIPPSEKVLLLRTADPAVSDPAAAAHAIASLARLSGFEKRGTLPESSSPVAVIGDARVMLYKEVDPAAEVERISREIARSEADISNCRKKLSNPSFVERAPPAVVEQERARLSEAEERFAKLQDQLKKLGPRK